MLAEKEVLGLIGPNGSGKTTMMNLISGALKPSSGEIRLYGEPISGTGASRVANKGVARTFQLVRMLPAMTALENVSGRRRIRSRAALGQGARRLRPRPAAAGRPAERRRHAAVVGA